MNTDNFGEQQNAMKLCFPRNMVAVEMWQRGRSEDEIIKAEEIGCALKETG